MVKSVNNRKTCQLQIRLSTAEKAVIKLAAKRANLDMSTWVLQNLLPKYQEEFKTLVRALKSGEQRNYVFAELNELLEKVTASEFLIMVAELPDIKLSPYLINYLAAMVEYAALRKGAKLPEWVNDIQPLKQPVFVTDLQSLRLHLLTSSPPPFRRRNIFIDASIGDRV